ncbi:DUF6538 domain-containing protein [Mycoplana ramosa]|uniref:DUF6538 domain-containing protein n=1 Tax=Mycoplana ramosa TaxID=40837 RepID=A0ABW3YT52_MYCRA
MSLVDATYLFKRNNTYYFRIAVPSFYWDKYGKQIWRSLRTGDLKTAKALVAELTAKWLNYFRTGENPPEDHHEKITPEASTNRAHNLGISEQHSPEEFLEAATEQSVDMLNNGLQALKEMKRPGELDFVAISGALAGSNLKLSGALDAYKKLTPGKWSNLDARAYDKKWRPFVRAVNDFIEMLGKVICKRRVWLQFTIFMLPSIVDAYKDTLIISANFDETLLAMMWSKDVHFQRNEWIQSRLRYQDMKHVADFVELYHAPVKNLSKTFLTRLGKGDEERGTQDYVDRVALCLGDMFPGREHIHCSNKLSDDKDYRWLLDDKGGQRVITNPFGWNTFKHCNMAVFLAAINYDPDTNDRLYAFYGITKAQAKNALCYQMIYQFLGRTMIRDKDKIGKPDDTGKILKVVCVLPDEGAAEAFQGLLGCAPSTPLPIDFGAQPKRGRPRVTKSVEKKREEEKLKKQRYREKKKAEQAAQMQLE